MQSYHWRQYSKATWELGKKTPLLIFASTWEDKKIHGERFCGAADLSTDKTLTEQLLGNSPHYFLISYTISE